MRPSVPLPPPDAWPFRPPPMDPFEMRWMRPLEFPPPPHHPDFRLSVSDLILRIYLLLICLSETKTDIWMNKLDFIYD